MVDYNDYTTLRFVDKVGDNFLFRGGSPIYNQSIFDYDGLSDTMKNWVGVWPERHYLVDISLFIDDGPNGNDHKELAVERAFFDLEPDRGQLVWWPTTGTSQCYWQTESDQRDHLVRTLDDWMSDKIIERTDALRYWLETGNLPQPSPTGLPYVFYVHCDGGCDRTGEVIGAYRLRYQGWSWLNAWSEQPCVGRLAPSGSGIKLPAPLGRDNYQALQWYAFWLNRELGFNLSDIGDDGGCNDAGWYHRACSPWTDSRKVSR